MQVLIFSQFKIMLDVLEDYLRLIGLPLERIDGSVAQRDREAAIDRYSAGAGHACSAQTALLLTVILRPAPPQTGRSTKTRRLLSTAPLIDLSEQPRACGPPSRRLSPPCLGAATNAVCISWENLAADSLAHPARNAARLCSIARAMGVHAWAPTSGSSMCVH